MRIIKSRRMRWAGHEERIEGFGGRARGKRPLQVLNARGRIILKLILEKYDEVVWAGFIWLRTGTNGGLFGEHGNKPSDSIKCWEILEKLSDW
jgi:hypothetical protein